MAGIALKPKGFNYALAAAKSHLIFSHSYQDYSSHHKAWLLVCYFSAIIHDYEHRGVNNDFLIKTSDPLATLYNDTSPMESHHVAAAFALMKDEQLSFFPGSGKKVWRSGWEFRHSICFVQKLKSSFPSAQCVPSLPLPLTLYWPQT